MIRTGTPSPALPTVLPGLAGAELHNALIQQRTRLAFLTEHLEHPLVSEGVVDAIHDALASVSAAVEIHTRAKFGLSHEWDGTARTVDEHRADEAGCCPHGRTAASRAANPCPTGLEGCE